jgi:hypothetical protein
MPEQPNPATRDPAQERQQKALTTVRDVHAGTLRMREKGEAYLPRMERESHKDYQARLGSSVLYNALKRTNAGLTGLVFRKDPALSEDVPEQIRQHWENIDNAGRHGDVFAKDHFADAFLDGHGAIFVDMAEVKDGDARDAEDERRKVGRPYWIHIEKGRILRARSAVVAGETVLSRFAYTETITEEAGEFEQREVLRVRDYRLAMVQKEGEREPKRRVLYVIYAKRKDDKGKERWEIDGSGTMSISRIPVATTYTNRTGYMESEPPLLDLALENIDHFQTRSDRKNVLRIASVPILALIGITDGEVEVGAHSALQLPDGGDAKYVEPTGTSLEESREELRESERRMATLGLSLLMSETRQAETATSKRIDKSESDSQLASAARALQDCLEEALRIHAEWLGLESGGSISVNRDFENLRLEAQTVQAYSSMVLSGQLSLETLWQMLLQGEVLPDTFDADEEARRIEARARAGTPGSGLGNEGRGEIVIPGLEQEAA